MAKCGYILHMIFLAFCSLLCPDQEMSIWTAGPWPRGRIRRRPHPHSRQARMLCNIAWWAFGGRKWPGYVARCWWRRARKASECLFVVFLAPELVSSERSDGGLVFQGRRGVCNMCLGQAGRPESAHKHCGWLEWPDQVWAKPFDTSTSHQEEPMSEQCWCSDLSRARRRLQSVFARRRSLRIRVRSSEISSRRRRKYFRKITEPDGPT